MLFPFFCLESMISISTGTQYIFEPNVNIKIVVTIKLYRNVSSIELFFGDGTSSKIYENELYIDNSTDTTAVFDKQYNSQGNYTLKALVMYAGVQKRYSYLCLGKALRNYNSTKKGLSYTRNNKF